MNIPQLILHILVIAKTPLREGGVGYQKEKAKSGQLVEEKELMKRKIEVKKVKKIQ
jgi:hypothetical protein